MASHTWTGGASDGNYSTAANWSGGVPTAGNDVYILRGSDTITSGMDQSAVNLASWTVGEDFTGTIGTSSSPLKLGTVTSLRVNSRLSSSINLWPATATECIIQGTYPALNALLFTQGTLTACSISGGSMVRFGTNVTATTTYLQQSGCVLSIDGGATITTLYVYDGKVISEAAIVTCGVNGGYVEQKGASYGNVTTLNMDGGTFEWSARGYTITTANVRRGFFDCSKDPNAKTVTTCNLWMPGRFRGNREGTITVTTFTNWGGVVENYTGTVTSKLGAPMGYGA